MAKSYGIILRTVYMITELRIGQTCVGFFVEKETYEKRIEALTSLVATMPEENRKLIVTIMKHLKK